jgi:integrase
MPSRPPSASPGSPADAPPSPAALFAALPASFQAPTVDFAAEPFARLTYAYPSRPPARLDLAALPEPMRQELAYWLHTLAQAGERVNSWALAEWVRIAAAVAAGQGLCSFTGLSAEEWMAAARRRYHGRHHRLPPPSYLHNHRATLTRLHDALALAYRAGQPWWRSLVWDPRHDQRIPVREHEPLEGQRLNFARVSPGWLREAIQWYFAAGLTTGLLSWSSLPGFLTYLGRHFGGFLAAEGIDTPDLGLDPATGLRPVALRLLAWLRQQRTRAGRPLAPSTVGLIQTTVSGFYAFMADRRAEAARKLAEPRWAGLSDAHARWWRPGEVAGSGSYRGQAEGNYIDAAALSRILEHADILGLPRGQAKAVVVNGTPRQIRGLGDEQAMRAFLLAIATGRRISEILMMDFAPLSPVPGLDASQAAQDGGPAARLRYQQTKIAGAPQAILVGADVTAIVTEQQDFARALVRAGDPAAGDPPYLFLAWQANTAGARHYRASTLNGLLTQLAAALQVTDATGALVDFQRTHRMRHTKATDLLNAGVPIHVVQRYMGHVSPEMTMHYAKTLAETHEAEFLRFAKLRRDGRPLEMDPADVYELVQLDRHTDRILPNGVCLLPPPKRCDRGNACLTCDHFATDARHLGELRAQLAATGQLIEHRQAQHRQRTGTEMGPGHIWLAERNAELASLRAITAALQAGQCPGAVRGAGVPARPGQPVPVTIGKKPEDHGHAR